MVELRAPMAGTVAKLGCRVGDRVEENEPVLHLEVMKMEAELYAPASGVVREIRVSEGDPVEEEDVLLVIEPV